MRSSILKNLARVRPDLGTASKTKSWCEWTRTERRTISSSGMDTRLVVTFVAVFVFTLFANYLQQRSSEPPPSPRLRSVDDGDDQQHDDCASTCGERVVDAVVLWVNGSDPWFRRTLATLKRRHRPHAAESALEPEDRHGAQRFRDLGQLRYALRSLERNVPFLRTVHLITNAAQRPHWLARDLSPGKLRVVPHHTFILQMR